MTRQRQSIELPPECNLRRAVATDAKQIEQMVHSEPLVPMGLHWSQFWVIERKAGMHSAPERVPAVETDPIGSSRAS